VADNKPLKDRVGRWRYSAVKVSDDTTISNCEFQIEIARSCSEQKMKVIIRNTRRSGGGGWRILRKLDLFQNLQVDSEDAIIVDRSETVAVAT
jgi:hypothetical protein